MTRRLGLAIAATLVLLAASACSNSDDHLEQTAVDYLVAVDAGDATKRCELQTLGVTDHSRCLDLAASNGGTHSFTGTPEVVRTADWANGGRLVVAQVALKANPDVRQFIAVTLSQTDGHWLVDDDAWVDDPNDDAAIAEDLS
jgi:hypothetical protein